MTKHGNDYNPFVLVMETSLKTLNVHIVGCKSIELKL